MNWRMPKWGVAGVLLILLFPPYTKFSYTGDGRRYESHAGWGPIFSLDRNERIRWEVLVLELAAMAFIVYVSLPGAKRDEPPILR